MKDIDDLTVRNVWEILVPTTINDKPVKTRYHKVWDEKVRVISGGLTILKPAKGQWISENPSNPSKLFSERVIPVRIACTKVEMFEIAKITKSYYEQLAVMFYKISDEVYFV